MAISNRGFAVMKDTSDIMMTMPKMESGGGKRFLQAPKFDLGSFGGGSDIFTGMESGITQPPRIFPAMGFSFRDSFESAEFQSPIRGNPLESGIAQDLGNPTAQMQSDVFGNVLGTFTPTLTFLGTPAKNINMTGTGSFQSYREDIMQGTKLGSMLGNPTFTLLSSDAFLNPPPTFDIEFPSSVEGLNKGRKDHNPFGSIKKGFKLELLGKKGFSPFRGIKFKGFVFPTLGEAERIGSAASLKSKKFKGFRVREDMGYDARQMMHLPSFEPGSKSYSKFIPRGEGIFVEKRPYPGKRRS
jgi:hypothetical protein